MHILTVCNVCKLLVASVVVILQNAHNRYVQTYAQTYVERKMKHGLSLYSADHFEAIGCLCVILTYVRAFLHVILILFASDLCFVRTFL